MLHLLHLTSGEITVKCLSIIKKRFSSSYIKIPRIFQVRVDRVNVDGLRRTQDDAVKGPVNDMFKANDFEDVIVRAEKVYIPTEQRKILAGSVGLIVRDPDC